MSKNLPLPFKRSKATYAPTGPTTRAALDFATKSTCFKGFAPEYLGLTDEGKRMAAIALFEARDVTSATFSFLIPEIENGRQLFIITFRPCADGYVPRVEIEIKSAEALRTQAKLYKSDSTAYAETRKPKRKGRRLDRTL